MTTLSGRALTMSSSAAGRACSSLSLTRSQAFGSSPLILTSAHLPRELLAVELELQLALLEREARLDHGRPRPAVPEHDRPRPVLALRDDPLEGAVLDRVVLDVHREPLVARVEGRALRHGPAQQDAVAAPGGSRSGAARPRASGCSSEYPPAGAPRRAARASWRSRASSCSPRGPSRDSLRDHLWNHGLTWTRQRTSGGTKQHGGTKQQQRLTD